LQLVRPKVNVPIMLLGRNIITKPIAMGLSGTLNSVHTELHERAKWSTRTQRKISTDSQTTKMADTAAILIQCQRWVGCAVHCPSGFHQIDIELVHPVVLRYMII
jgi:hypothetical protein